MYVGDPTGNGEIRTKMDLALLLKLAAPPVSISVAVQNIVVMLAIVVVGMLCYLLIENFIEVCPDLACVNVY